MNHIRPLLIRQNGLPAQPIVQVNQLRVVGTAP